MSDRVALKISEILEQCNDEERQALFKALRATHQIHELEAIFGTSSEVILEAIHRAPELTRRMLRGVIADAAFAQFTVPMLAQHGWKNVTPPGNFTYDHVLDDGKGPISIQVKLQRSKEQRHEVTTGRNYGGMRAGIFVVETQKTRGGTKKGLEGEEETKTRPYRFGDFDVLAVSLQPSGQKWTSFRYTVGSWLVPGKGANEIATFQPVSATPDDDWTDDFNEVASWFRSGIKKTIVSKPKDLLG
jgi:hypothetical protein